MDVFAQTLVEHFFLDGTAFLVGKHPVGKLRVPAKAVSTQLNAVLAGEVSDAVGSTPVPFAFLRLQHTRFHVVLSRHAVKLLAYKCSLFRHADVKPVDSDTDFEVVLISFLQCRIAGFSLWSSKLCLCTGDAHSKEHQGKGGFC